MNVAKSISPVSKNGSGRSLFPHFEPAGGVGRRRRAWIGVLELGHQPDVEGLHGRCGDDGVESGQRKGDSLEIVERQSCWPMQVVDPVPGPRLMRPPDSFAERCVEVELQAVFQLRREDRIVRTVLVRGEAFRRVVVQAAWAEPMPQLRQPEGGVGEALIGLRVTTLDELPPSPLLSVEVAMTGQGYARSKEGVVAAGSASVNRLVGVEPTWSEFREAAFDSQSPRTARFGRDVEVPDHGYVDVLGDPPPASLGLEPLHGRASPSTTAFEEVKEQLERSFLAIPELWPVT